MTARFHIREADASERNFVSDTLSGMMWPLLPEERKRDAEEAETATMVRRHVDFILDSEGAVALIAEDAGGERVGVLLMGERRHIFTGGYEGFVHYVFVVPGSRLDGVGGQLLSEAEQLARRRNYVFLNLEIMVQNHPMQSLARSLRYQEEYVGYRKFLDGEGANEDRTGA